MKEKRRRQDGERGGKEMRESKEKRREEWRRGEERVKERGEEKRRTLSLSFFLSHRCRRSSPPRPAAPWSRGPEDGGAERRGSFSPAYLGSDGHTHTHTLKLPP